MAKISKESAQRAKDEARAEKQRILGSPRKNLTSQQNERLKELSVIIDAADAIINKEE